MPELTAVQLFEEITNPRFVFKSREGYYSFLTIENNYDDSKMIKVHVDGNIFSIEEPKVCKVAENNDDVILYFSDLLIKFSGNIKEIQVANYEEFKHWIVFAFTETKVYFYDVYYDSVVGKRNFAFLGEIENINLLYMAFNEYKTDCFEEETRKKVITRITPQIFNEIKNSYYGADKFTLNFTLVKGTNVVAPYGSRIQANYNIILRTFAFIEGYKRQKIVAFQLNKDSVATMKTVDIPNELIINRSSKWVITKNKVILLDSLEVFDVSFLKNAKKKVSLEYTSVYQKFNIRTVNGKKILVIHIKNDLYILWNLSDNSPFLYNSDEKGDLERICLIDKADIEKYSWNGKWIPHIFLKNKNMLILPEEQRVYDIYYNYHNGEELCISSLGKPHVLECRDGTVVYFVKMINEDNSIVGTMLVLDNKSNLVEFKQNIDLVSIYEGIGSSGIKFVFVERN